MKAKLVNTTVASSASSLSLTCAAVQPDCSRLLAAGGSALCLQRVALGTLDRVDGEVDV
jgi:hypothetical protein